MSFSILDPIGIHKIFEPSGQGDSSSGDRQADADQKHWAPGQPPPAQWSPAYQEYLSYQRGQDNAGAAANAAGNSTIAQRDYASGSHWAPGQPAPADKTTVAYQDYQSYQRGQDNAGAAANAAGNLAVANHDNRVATQTKAETDAEAQQRAAAGLDMMKPGAAEDFNAQHGADILKPGAYDDWLTKNAAQMGQPGAAENYASQVLQKYGVGGPGVAPADYGAYYDRAEERATQGLNKQLASRGQYGSSVGLGLIGTQLSDMEAQKARDEADYNLKRSADTRDWTSAVGSLQNSAQDAATNRWQVGGQASALSDTLGLSRWKLAESAADSAQDHQRTRGQDLFNNERGIGGDVSTIAGSSYNGAITQDQALMDAIQALKTGQSAEGVAKATAGAQADAGTQQQLMQLLAAYYASQNQPAAAGAKK